MDNQKKKGGCLKWILIVAGVLIVLAIIGAVAGSGDNTPVKVEDAEEKNSQSSTEGETEDNASESSDQTEDLEQTSFGVGETAEMNDIQVTLIGYEESSGSEYNAPSEGNVFMLINFEIANNSDTELNISSMMNFEAYADDYALNYSLNALLENDSANQLDGTIAAGKKMNGVIGYEVPADWSEMEIHFTDNVWSDGEFVFVITK